MVFKKLKNLFKQVRTSKTTRLDLTTDQKKTLLRVLYSVIEQTPEHKSNSNKFSYIETMDFYFSDTPCALFRGWLGIGLYGEQVKSVKNLYDLLFKGGRK